ncbi:MAG: alpha/beta hydrolase-fold protein [Planctomycetota bacterium]|nr:alpha/beta hydrolase-fold protein [Planctomycetota bacterium]
MKPQFLHFYQQQTRTLNLNFLLFSPETDHDPNRRYPLVLFLHGAGERGEELERLLDHSIPDIIEQQKREPFFLLAPQCPNDSYWILHRESLTRLLDEFLGSYPVDRSRIYLTGVSMGAETSWLLALQNPDLFAAFVPVCGRGPWWADFPNVAGELNRLPIWAFHGDADTIMPVQHSRALVARVNDCGGSARYTEYEGVDHDSWNRAFKEDEMYDWLFQQRR